MRSRTARLHLLGVLGAALGAATIALPAAAHHGWSGNAEDVSVTGVVESAVNLSGPHGTMQIRDAEGSLWDITMAPAPRTHRAGLREGIIPVGAEVTVEGERNRDPERREIKVRRVSHAGVDYDVYPPKRP
jgi:hypothetical protein